MADGESTRRESSKSGNRLGRLVRFLGQDGLHQRPRHQRREPVRDSTVARHELRPLLLDRQNIERSAPDELRDQRPRLADGSDRFVKRQFVEGSSLDQVGQRKQPLHCERAFEDNTMNVADESAVRVEPALAHRVREELLRPGGRDGCSRRRAAVAKDSDRVSADKIQLLE
jgi:hypothetical protein